MEYRLKEFSIGIYKLGKVLFRAIEPNETNHNFQEISKSQTYGTEGSFTHNYPLLFKNAGFELWHLSHKSFDDLSKQTFVGAKN
jgi:hypothetical protein